jgi:mono/diheme cytochrome c family protein
MVATGDSIFHARGCKNCHGMDAKGSVGGPNLVKPDHWLHVDGSFQGFVNIITTGVPAAEIKDPSHHNPMGPRGGRPTPLTDDQIKTVAAYVYSLNHM